MVLYWIALIMSFLLVPTFFWLGRRNGRGGDRPSQLLSPSRSLAIGTFLSTLVLFLPYNYLEVLRDMPIPARVWQSLWLGVYQALRFFVVAAEYDDLQAITAACGLESYTILGTILLILAPVLTFGVILSFFRGFEAYRAYFLHPRAPSYVFSELNEKSLHLATDVRNNHPDAIILFANVFNENNEEISDLSERAREIGAICFDRDTLSLSRAIRAKNSPLFFFAIAEDQSVNGALRQLHSATTAEEENLRQAARIVNHPYYSKRPNTRLYVFSSSAQGELLLDNLPDTTITVRRVEHSRPLIIRTLFESGHEFLFENAAPQPDGTKAIRALIIGAGSYGREMIKTLCWCCQMKGYSLSIDVVDRDPQAEDRFAFHCPGLMENRNASEGMPRFSITFHCGVSADTDSFVKVLRKIPRPTYVLASLGNDEMNLDTALTVRRVYSQTEDLASRDPFIHAIIYESENKQGLEGATNVRGERYDIHYIGDLASSYSERVIINEEMISTALARHMRFSNREFTHDIHQRSSMAVTLYEHLAHLCGQSTVEDTRANPPTDEARKEALRAEHIRWCAYMFAEGYVFAPLTGRRSNTIAKTHRDLVPYDEMEDLRQAPKETPPNQ